MEVIGRLVSVYMCICVYVRMCIHVCIDHPNNILLHSPWSLVVRAYLFLLHLMFAR